MNKFLLTLALCTASINYAAAQNLTISLTNLTHGSHFTPLLFGVHPSDQHLFEIGTTSSANLQAMAEGGDTSGLVTDLTALSTDISNDPGTGLTAPGQTVSFDMNNTQTLNVQLSVVGMILPSNDGFVGLDALDIPTEVGTYTYYLNAYDAGTEANDELIVGMSGGASGTPGIPADPLGENGTGGTGVAGIDTNDTVHVHRGVIGDTNASGGSSDLNSTIHRWLNPVARLIIEVK